MPLENIIKRIVSDAKEEAEQIKKEAEEKAKKVTSEGKNEAERRRREIAERAKARAENERRGILSQARIESKNLVLVMKQELVDSVFKNALEELLSLPEAKHKSLLRNLLFDVEGIERGTIICSPEERKHFGSKFISEINEALKRKGKKTYFELSKEAPSLPRGFIVKGDGIEINYTFSTLLGSVREELEPEVMKILLGE